MKKLFVAILICLGFVACSDPSESLEITQGEWSATMRGDGEVLGAYPDLYSNYWEYTYNLTDYPEVALCIQGQFPHARYFSFSLYNDETGDAVGGINDFEMQPDAGSVNPFVVTSAEANYFTLYVVPPTMSEEQIAKLPSKNICRIDANIRRLAICIRHYLGTNAQGEKHEFGGVEMPAIRGIDIHTLEEVNAPAHAETNISKVTGKAVSLKADNARDVPFLLAPKSEYYPNNSTSYLYARTRLTADSVLIFSFIPTPVPERVEDYATAKARYWSICLGAASNTRSYYSVCDEEAQKRDGEKSTFIICTKQNSALEAIQQKVQTLNEAGGLWNLFVWDSEKLDINGKPIEDVIAIMYRNILADKTWEYSIAQMTPTTYTDAEGEPLDKIKDANKQLAHKALGDYGPYGFKYATSDFLRDDFRQEEY